MSTWEPGVKRVSAAAISNWYAEPLAVDGALAEPLRRLQTTRVAVRGAVRGLLVRRLLARHEVDALRAAGVGPLELSQVFGQLLAGIPAVAAQAGPLGTMVRALGRVVRNAPDVAALGDEHAMHRAIGSAVAHALAEDLYPRPPPDSPDMSKHQRKAVHELLTARTITEETLEAIFPLDRMHLAGRLEARLRIMQAVVPPSRGEALERLVRVASVHLRRTPPVDAWTLDAALAEQV